MMKISWIIAIHVVVLATYGTAALGDEAIIEMGQEDGFVEFTGAFAFLLASLCFFICYLRSEGGNDFFLFKTRRNVFFLLLAGAFLFAGGEEISWGQRIFGWDTPDSLAEVNSQGETTIHNLAIFQEQKLIRFHLIYNVFWMSYCVLLPLIALVRWPRELIQRIAIPIPPIWCGTLLLSSYVMFKIAASGMPHGEGEEGARHAFNELKETNSAIGFAVLAVYFLARAWNRSEESAADRAEDQSSSPSISSGVNSSPAIR